MSIDIQITTADAGQLPTDGDACATAGNDVEWPKCSDRNIDMLRLLNEVFESAELIPALPTTAG